jgi:hypothetical protein
MDGAPLLERFIDAQLAAAAKADKATPPRRKRTASPRPQGSSSPEEASKATPKKAKKGPPTLQELREALPSPGDLALEEVLLARYMFA